MAGAKFTWQEKFSDVVNEMPEEHQLWFMKKIMDYGMFGIDPEFEWPFTMAFAAIKEDIDNSNAQRNGGKNSGKSKTSKKEQEPSSLCQNLEKASSLSENLETFCDSEKPSSLSENLEEPSSLCENLRPHTIPDHTIPDQSKPNQEKRGARKFAPPSLEEALAYCEEANLVYLNAENLWNYYESQGWKKANGQKLTDWKAAFCGANSRDKPKNNPPEEVSELAAKYADAW